MNEVTLVNDGINMQRSAAPPDRKGWSVGGAAFLAFAFLSSFNTGAYLVLISWTATEITGDATLVGTLFLSALALGVVLSNLTGVVADRVDRPKIMLGATLVSLAAGLVLVLSFQDLLAMEIGLVAFTIVRAIGGAFVGTAMAGIFQTLFRKEERTKRVAEVGICSQIGIASGSGVAGLFLIYPGGQWLATMLVAITAVQTCLVLAFPRQQKTPGDTGAPGQRGLGGLVSDWREGVSYVLRSSSTRHCIIALAALMSVAQLTNTLVPAFVMNDLGKGASSYGTMEAAWAIGGTLVLVLARHLQVMTGSRHLDLICLGAIGTLMVLFAFNRVIEVAYGLYFALGALFALTRALVNARLMIEVDNRVIGRVMSAGQLLTNAVGVMIFSLPWFIETSTVTSVYIGWGAALLCASAIFYFRHLQDSR
jgi:MFS family permease